MTQRAIKSAVVLSSSLLGICAALVICGFATNPWDHCLSLHESLHVGVWNRGLDSRIVFFDNAEQGPYRGSLIGLVDADGNVHPPLEREAAFGDAWGIYIPRLSMVRLAGVDVDD